MNEQRVGPYAEEVYSRVQQLDADVIAHGDEGPQEALLRIANETAAAHPVWYERFRLRTILRKLMRP